MGDSGPFKNKKRIERTRSKTPASCWFYYYYVYFIFNISKALRGIESLSTESLVYHLSFHSNRWRKVKREINERWCEKIKQTSGELMERVNSYTRTCWSFPQKCFKWSSDGSLHDRDNRETFVFCSWLIFLVIGINRQAKQPPVRHF